MAFKRAKSAAEVPAKQPAIVLMFDADMLPSVYERVLTRVHGAVSSVLATTSYEPYDLQAPEWADGIKELEGAHWGVVDSLDESAAAKKAAATERRRDGYNATRLEREGKLSKELAAAVVEGKTSLEDARAQFAAEQEAS